MRCDVIIGLCGRGRIGFAICPYRIAAAPEFVAAMQALGYEIVDRWQSFERHLEVPFAATGCDVDSYHGYYFCRQPKSTSADRLQWAAGPTGVTQAVSA